VTPEREAALRVLEERLGHRFRELALLDRALTHTSFAHEALEDGAGHNEALEFLGDAVIGLVVAEMLHEQDPEGREGRKTAVRGRLVAARSQAERAEALGLADLLNLGRGEKKTGIRMNKALWADAYEAVIAALYLDGGLAAASRFLRREFGGRLHVPSPSEPGGDAKTALQEILHKGGAEGPEYRVVADEGADSPTRFRIQCLIAGTVEGEGVGYSKKEAQQDAARRALEAVRGRTTGGEVR
jgi:ribonuclease III